MRSEKEMHDLILGYANADENIRAVILNGSRANPNRKPDPFNDFDIVYLVRDLTPCKEKAYYKDFGEILVFERTDESELFEEHFPEFVCYLMQFADGNRIDLTVSSIDRWEGYCYDDRLSVVLLDKDNVLPKLPEPGIIDRLRQTLLLAPLLNGQSAFLPLPKHPAPLLQLILLLHFTDLH